MRSPSTVNSHPPINSPWSCLETLPGLIALARVWRARLDEMFEQVKALILQDNPNPAQVLPCPRGCGLAHDIVCRPDGTLVATCCGDPSQPQEIPLTPAEIMPLEVSWSKLRHVLCEALGLHDKPATLPLPNTIQIGAWTADGVPVILTIQVCRATFRRVVAELVARLQGPFILLAPTSDHFDAPCQELLAHARAGFFPLETTVLLDENGRLRPVNPPGELFAQFTPQPREADEEVARRAFALVRTLDTERPMKPPTLLTVFRLYCMEEMSAAAIGQRFGCSKAAAQSRLNLIRQRTGAKPENLRRLCVWLAKIAEGASDPRASHIRRRRLISDDQDPLQSCPVRFHTTTSIWRTSARRTGRIPASLPIVELSGMTPPAPQKNAMKKNAPATTPRSAAQGQTPGVQRRINDGWLRLWSAVYPSTPPPVQGRRQSTLRSTATEDGKAEGGRRKSDVRGQRSEDGRRKVEGRKPKTAAALPEERRPAAVDYLDSLLCACLALTLLVTGCASPRPLKGGRAVTTHKPAGSIEQTLLQSENPA